MFSHLINRLLIQFKRVKLIFRSVNRSYNVRPEKVMGLSTGDLVRLWLMVNMPDGYYIVLKDIDASQKDINFWSKMPRDTAIKFIEKDVIVFSVKDMREAERLMMHIPLLFAKATVYKNGEEQYNNYEEMVE